MAGRGKILALGLALILVVGIVASASLAGNEARTAATQSISFNFAELAKGKLRGLVLARQKGANTTVRVTVSLHRLTADRRYRVGGYAKPCSRIVDAADFAIWRKG